MKPLSIFPLCGWKLNLSSLPHYSLCWYKAILRAFWCKATLYVHDTGAKRYHIHKATLHTPHTGAKPLHTQWPHILHTGAKPYFIRYILWWTATLHVLHTVQRHITYWILVQIHTTRSPFFPIANGIPNIFTKLMRDSRFSNCSFLF